MSLGEYRLPHPVVGPWPFPCFPSHVRAAGRLFERAQWKWPYYPEVVEQYREVRPRGSAHLKVYEDWTWRIDHIDDDNPDRGRVVEHGLNDTALGKAVKGVALGAAAVGAGYLLAQGIAAVVDMLPGPRRQS